MRILDSGDFMAKANQKWSRHNLSRRPVHSEDIADTWEQGSLVEAAGEQFIGFRERLKHICPFNNYKRVR